MYYLPGCIFGFWHMWGVLQSIPPGVPMECVSGSSLAAAVHACGCDVYEQLAACAALRADLVRNPLRLRAVVRAFLRAALPADAVERCQRRRVCVLLRRVVGMHVDRVSAWTDRDDLIECLVTASVPVPARYRGAWCMDCVRTTTSSGTPVPARVVTRVPTPAEARALYDAGLTDGKKIFCGSTKQK